MRNFAQRLFGALQSNQQRFAVHVLQQALDTAIVDLHQVFEQEHLVDDLLRQLAIVFAHRVDNGFFLLGFHQVDNLGGGTHSAHFAALEVLVVEQVVEYFGQLRQRRRLHAAEGGDTQHHVVAQALIELRQNISRLTALEMDQDGGDDLRVFIADQVGGALRLHKVERLHPGGGFAGFEDILQQAGGTLFAQRFHQHRSQVVAGVNAQGGELFGIVFKFRQDLAELFMRDLAHAGHGAAQKLDFAGG